MTIVKPNTMTEMFFPSMSAILFLWLIYLNFKNAKRAYLTNNTLILIICSLAVLAGITLLAITFNYMRYIP